MKIYRNIDQGSVDWFRLRMGIPTASCFHMIMSPKRRKMSAQHEMYICRLIAERLSNEVGQSISGIENMERGKELEPHAVKRFEIVNEVQTAPVSFIKTDDEAMGCSPDRVIWGSDETSIAQMLEIKSPTLPVHLKYHLFGLGDAYACQVQGQMLIAETDESIFYSYRDGDPAFTLITHRDEKFVADLSACLRQFCDKLHEMHELAQRIGDWKRFADIVMPVEKEYDPDDLAADE